MLDVVDHVHDIGEQIRRVGQEQHPHAETDPPHDASPPRPREQHEREHGGDGREEQVPDHEPVNGPEQEGVHAPSVNTASEVASTIARATRQGTHTIMTDLSLLDATAQAALVQSGEASAAELVDAAIGRIEKLNDDVNAVIHPLFDRARAAVASGLPSGPFTGVPIVVKDLDGTLAGAPYHAGNIALKNANYVATTTSYIFEKLERAGFVIVAKTNTPEFGLMPTAEPQAYGPTHNPWNLAHSSGGSSGGSAAAVASGMVPVGHAGDGGGSIRIPASMCGLFGLKPTRGRVSLGPAEHESWAGPRDASRRVAQRARQRGGARRVAGLHDRRLVHRATTRRGRTRTRSAQAPGKLRIGVRTTAPLGIATVDPECIARGRGHGAPAGVARSLRRRRRARRARRRRTARNLHHGHALVAARRSRRGRRDHRPPGHRRRHGTRNVGKLRGGGRDRRRQLRRRAEEDAGVEPARDRVVVRRRLRPVAHADAVRTAARRSATSPRPTPAPPARFRSSSSPHRST